MYHYHFWISKGRRLAARVLFWLVFGIVAGWCQPGQAQWITQTNTLVTGWNSVYLHLDASHTNVNDLILDDPGNTIEEIWMWSFDLPPGLSVANPPDGMSSQWSKWTRIGGANSALKTLPANAALLVKATAGFPWKIKGRPVAPNYRWTLSGLNFVGFPAATPAPTFLSFLAADAQPLEWPSSSEIFRYPGGEAGAPNPIQVTLNSRDTNTVAREQAYWIRTGEPTNQVYNHYFGPFQVIGGGSSGLRFGDSQGQARLYLKNMTAEDLTVTLGMVASESSPAGAMPTLLPMMVRGSINTSNLTFSYSDLRADPSSWSLAPYGQVGSEVEIVLGVDRAEMAAMGESDFAAVLRFTDSLGLSRVDIGASATTPSRAGLWVGNAVVDQVSQYIKQYVTATNTSDFHGILNQKNLTIGVNNPSGTNVLPWAVSPDEQLRYEWDANTGLVLVFGLDTATGRMNTGTYLQKGPIVTNLTAVARPVPLRLIVHNSGSTIHLMQRAYLGFNDELKPVVAARQEPIKDDLANARRISAVHLPTSDGNGPWTFSGIMEQGEDLVTTVILGFRDQASNPFLHTYHPDHDNLNALYDDELDPGAESYDIWRLITLSFEQPGNDFDSRTRGGTSLGGNYRETVSIRAETTVLREFNVLGLFSLTRITDTAEYAP